MRNQEHSCDPDTRTRLIRLERRLRRTQIALLAIVAVAMSGIALGLRQQQQQQQEPDDQPVHDVIRTKRLIVLDDRDQPRVVIGQDPQDTQRRSRAAGITIHDRHGHERGGFSTMDDGSVVFAMDAPVGVGSPMRDRLGLVVWPDGSCHVMLLDNQTRAVAKLHSDGQGGGGVQVFKWDMDAKKIHIKTITYDGEETENRNIGE